MGQVTVFGGEFVHKRANGARVQMGKCTMDAVADGPHRGLSTVVLSAPMKSSQTHHYTWSSTVCAIQIKSLTIEWTCMYAFMKVTIVIARVVESFMVSMIGGHTTIKWGLNTVAITFSVISIDTPIKNVFALTDEGLSQNPLQYGRHISRPVILSISNFRSTSCFRRDTMLSISRSHGRYSFN